MLKKTTIQVKGQASHKIIKLIDVDTQKIPAISLMAFLIEQGITVASSCGGEGKCRKCVVNNSLISCQISLKNFIENHGHDVEISYL